MEWSEIKLHLPENFPHDVEEAVSSHLWELGIAGINESAPGQMTAYAPKDQVPQILSGLNRYLTALMEMNPIVGKVTFEAVEVANTNWSEKYREYFSPRPLARFFYLVPEWTQDLKVPGDRIPIRMEAGQAFGTGLHPSTRLCLSLFERQGLTWPKPKQLRVLDVGTGSGLLAIAAEKFGATEVYGVDNDPIAVEVAVENIQKNRCQRTSVSNKPIADVKDQYDIILSNILLEVHQELFAEYDRLLAKDGRLIISGLLGSQRNEMEELATKHGFRLEAVQLLQEWLAFTFHRGKG